MLCHVSNLVPRCGLEIPVWGPLQVAFFDPSRVHPPQVNESLIRAARHRATEAGRVPSMVLHFLGYRTARFEHSDLRGQNPYMGHRAHVDSES
jgi:hypothetical protein